MSPTKYPLFIDGLPGGAEARWLLDQSAALAPLCAVTRSDEEAQNLWEDLTALHRWSGGEGNIAVYSPEEDESRQALALSRWAGPRADASLLVCARSLAEIPTPTPERWQAFHQSVTVSDHRDRDPFLRALFEAGYQRVDTVEQEGEAAVRGEVVDLWAPGLEKPVRLLWPYDQVEAMHWVDLISQRSQDPIAKLHIPPAKIGLGEPAVPLIKHLPNSGTLFLSRPDPAQPLDWPGRRVEHTLLESAAQREPYLPAPTFAAAGEARARLLAQQLQTWIEEGWRSVIFCHNRGELDRLKDLLLAQDRKLLSAVDQGQLQLIQGPMTRGYLDPARREAVLTNGEIFGRTRRRFRLPTFSGESLAQVADVRPGDFVVHEKFGVGRFRGLKHLTAAGTEGDYLQLEYRGGDRVYVPLWEFRQVQKYIGAEGKRPTLSSLDTATWDRTKLEVRQAVAELARELLQRAAQRSLQAGHAFTAHNTLEEEFGRAFLYDLTPDQARAIQDVQRDMVAPTPMDRVICGDVGYGKTEVAMRAAMTCAVNGKQCALLAPTTILAEQHGRTFRDRFADYPVTIGVLTRFTPPAEAQQVLDQLSGGGLDIVIGTHRLLSRDVHFKNLGLLIIDEEHRFGVRHKERFKALRANVDSLALSATPIPRTLGATLGGLKNLSVIESPPEGRLPIATHVGPFSPPQVAAAVEQELRRGGQVFYVHNRIGTLEERRQWLTQTLGEHDLSPRIALAHGKMSGEALEKVMWEFLHRRYDLLLATSIIESGLDIPTVNTLIVEEAEDFGLAQLYQLRGRVGRERLKAYCFLFYSPGISLTEEAEQRLSALKEFAALGSGFKLALRDMEIRGTGNLLGAQQHGFVRSVGIDLYGRLLAEEIERQRGETPTAPAAPDPELEIPAIAYLPETTLPSESERVLFYKRLLEADGEGLIRLKEELQDRCGRLPPPAEQLFEVAKLRLAARQAQVTRLQWNSEGLVLQFREGVNFLPETVEKLTRMSGQGLSFLAGPPVGLRWEGFSPRAGFPALTSFLDTLR